jgi:hypothetical protein
MAIIDITTIKRVKHQTTPQQGIPINIKPDLFDVNNKPIDLSGDMDNLLKAQYVLLENQ